jgi:hypothetical protein
MNETYVIVLDKGVYERVHYPIIFPVTLLWKISIFLYVMSSQSIQQQNVEQNELYVGIEMCSGTVQWNHTQSRAFSIKRLSQYFDST